MKRWHFYVGLAVVLAVAAVVLMPLYGDYAVRAAVANGIASTGRYRQTLAEAIQNQGKLPLDAKRLPVPDARDFDKSVRSVGGSTSGELRITFRGHASIEGRSIVQVPTVTAGGTVERWNCYNIDMPERELPTACRAKRQ